MSFQLIRRFLGAVFLALVVLGAGPQLTQPVSAAASEAGSRISAPAANDSNSCLPANGACALIKGGIVRAPTGDVITDYLWMPLSAATCRAMAAPARPGRPLPML